MDNKYIRFNKNQYGKPCFEEYPDFDFNISHSRDYVKCPSKFRKPNKKNGALSP